jgi:putative ABC transport system permease protein
MLRAVPLAETVFVDREETRQQLLLLQTAVGFVLLIACVNIGSLLLARATARQHEFALRVAIGAGRGRILRQLLTESLLLAGLAGFGGLLLSTLGTRVVANVWGWHQTTPFDARVLAFTSAVGLGTAILASLAPARHLLRHTDQTALRETGRNGSLSQTSRRMLNALLVCEISLALGLLVGAGVLIKGLSLRLQRTPGFATEHLLLARTHFLGLRYAATDARAEFIRRAVEEIVALPGVRAASVVDPYPPAGDAGFPVMAAGGHDFGDGPPLVRHRSATWGYFGTLGVTMIRGRDFNVRDVGSVPGRVIINEAMARRFWSGENPVGESITTTRAGQSVALVVIGVVATGDNNLEYRPEPRPEIVELTTAPSQAPWFMVRTDPDPMQLLPAIRAAVLTVDSNQPLAAIRTVEGWITQESAGHRSLAQFLAGFAVLALALVAIGIYGIVSYVAALRRREMGVRVALGASPASILGLLLGNALRLLMLAIPLGLAASWALTRWMAALLFGVGLAEPSILVSAALCVVVAIGLAAIRPAWRCTRIDPASVLRAE